MPGILNWFDPSFYAVALPVRFLILRKEEELTKKRVQWWIPVRHTPLAENVPDHLIGLNQDQLDYVAANVIKHRVCLWAVALFTAIFWRRILEVESSQLETFFLMGSALVGGLIVGWFAMSLKSLPDRYGDLGILITGLTFTAFIGGSMLIPVVVTKTGDAWLIGGSMVIVLLLYYGTMLYDFADLLNLGLEPLQKRYFEKPYVNVMGELAEAIREQAAVNKELLAAQQEILEQLRPRQQG